MDLDVETGTVGDASLLSLRGEIDVYTAPRLRQAIIDLVEGGATRIVVDMEKVDFLDSTGLGVLVGGLKRVRVRDGSLSIVTTQDKILKIFDITGLNRVFAIHPSVDAADAGPGIDPSLLEHDAELDSEEFTFERGLSLPLIRGLVDHLEILPREPKGSVVRMRLALAEGQPE